MILIFLYQKHTTLSIGGGEPDDAGSPRINTLAQGLIFRIRTGTGTAASRRANVRLVNKPTTSTKARMPAPTRIVADSIISTTFPQQN